MKTKIIYISGNEVFKMADIRAAFEEVRDALGLGKDTILFGVPVDADDACCAAKKEDTETVIDVAIEQQVQDTEIQVLESENSPEFNAVSEDNTHDNLDDIAQKTDEIDTIAENESDNQPEHIDNCEKVIPILSILGGTNLQSDTYTTTQDDTNNEIVEEKTDTETVSATNEEIINEIEPNIEDAPEEKAQEVSISNIDLDTQIANENENPVSITDMIDSDAPVQEPEKSIEQLLESMAPLREDLGFTDNEQVVSDFLSEDTIDDAAQNNDADTDATLELLATEFAQNQDNFTEPTKKTTGQGKIGKLKNILPFKKTKRNDETGLMGDLFGWAGVAANDDEFTIPGFFATASNK